MTGPEHTVVTVKPMRNSNSNSNSNNNNNNNNNNRDKEECMTER